MKLVIKYSKEKIKSTKNQCLVLFLSDTKPSLSALSPELKAVVQQAYKIKSFSGKAESTLTLYPNQETSRLLLVGLGELKNLNAEKLRRIVGIASRILVGMDLDSANILLPKITKKTLVTEIGSLVSEALVLGAYEFRAFKSENLENPKRKEMKITINDLEESTTQLAIQQGIIRAEGVNFARNLGNTPANHLTPNDLAQEAKDLAEQYKLKISILEESDMKQLGMNMFLGVSQGSSEPAKLICLEYKKSENTKTLAIVGKGVTFDSGGISIKPSANMDEMKFDMCGAAAVMGTMKSVGELNPDVNVIGFIAATENMPGASAQRPGDIVTSYSGKTVEILNTDAEGRLILGDTLTYAARNYSPDAIIDLATLTGAAVIALGHYATAAITNHDELLSQVVTAGNNSGERICPMPNFPEYAEALTGKYGDLQNIGGRDAGTITAGLFLKNFVEDVPWVHLDIAGTAWGVKNIGYIPHSGATGVGVRLLLNFIENWK